MPPTWLEVISMGLLTIAAYGGLIWLGIAVANDRERLKEEGDRDVW